MSLIEDALIAELAESKATRDHVGTLYAMALTNTGVAWANLNAAIIERWSESGLGYVKKLAWKIRGDEATPAAPGLIAHRVDATGMLRQQQFTIRSIGGKVLSEVLAQEFDFAGRPWLLHRDALAPGWTVSEPASGTKLCGMGTCGEQAHDIEQDAIDCAIRTVVTKGDHALSAAIAKAAA